MKNGAMDVWILSVPARDPGEAATWKAWLEAVTDAAPVEIELDGQSLIWMESYFDSEVGARLVREALHSEFPTAESTLRPCPQRDWTTFWRRHFQPVSVGRRLLVLPEWLEEEARKEKERTVIRIHPGLSFGTGNHFTTCFCLEALDRLASEGFRPDSMLDAGCGSAILSIAARKLGWKGILAVDHDGMAMDQAELNLRLNDIDNGVELRRMDLVREWPPGRFSLVVANLYGGLLMDLAPRLVRSCGGTLLLSGIREVEVDAVSTVFSRLGAVERHAESDGEWCGLVLDCASCG